MKPETYSMAFSTGGLFHAESVKLCTRYLEVKDWDIVRIQTIESNLLQTRTATSLKRVYREVFSRLVTLREEELEFLALANETDQAYLIWISICRRYPFIAEFASEVLRERYLSLKTDLHHEDFDSFFNRKSQWHPEIERITPMTRSKLRQVLFKMLREAGLLSTDNIILPSMMSNNLLELIRQQRPEELSFFPIFDYNL
ncbi:MAG: Brex phage defense system component BrxA [Bacteroidetes bacterium HLUCCA01]|nr:MAG: Brex phage defense system component BrxA [Bacteroidetes bacterium HLUCCA01]